MFFKFITCIYVLLAYIGNCSTLIVQKRIWNGQEALPHSVPSQVALIDELSKKLFCGGVLISSNTLLTAGHCLSRKPRENVLLKFGAHDYSADEPSQQTRIPTEIIQHPLYMTKNGHNSNYDLSLVKFNPILRSSSVTPTCLATNNLQPGDLAQVSGWGQSIFWDDLPNATTKLNTGLLSIKSMQNCTTKAKELYEPGFGICGYSPNVAGLPGDSGGPIFGVSPNSSSTLHGIASHVYLNSGDGHYSIYIDIVKHLDWIYEVLS